jgi:hypothetical protein
VHRSSVANRFFENFPAHDPKFTSSQTGEDFFHNLAAQELLFPSVAHFVQEISCTHR